MGREVGAQEVLYLCCVAGRLQHVQHLHAAQTQGEQLQGQSMHASPTCLALTNAAAPPPSHAQPVLETIRYLMNTECVVPDWLHDIFLGYGDPAAAQYKK